MAYTEIAPFCPFDGAPSINTPDIFGASPAKELFFRIAVTGERPMSISVDGLPEGLFFDGNNVIRGKSDTPGSYNVRLCAENTLGRAEKNVVFEIGDGKLQLTPLLGFTSWNAYTSKVTQEDIIRTTDDMEKLGILEYGYSYINTDSAWQGEYGGKYDAIMPNEHFPDMKAMCDHIHSKGLKAGIYSTPMLHAWGCPADREYIPGCTVGEADIRFSDTNTGIGVERKEINNVRQWSEWGFDYLKYDWCPCDAYNAEEMRKALISSDRDFTYCVTVRAIPEYSNYWGKYVNSYRSNNDCNGTWATTVGIYNSFFGFRKVMTPGHFFDLDMLDIGVGNIYKTSSGKPEYTEDEIIAVFSMRAFLNSPVQISAKIHETTDFERAVFCNEEIISISQDKSANTPFMIYMRETGRVKVHAFRKNLSDGGFAVCIFNLGEEYAETELCFEKTVSIRDAWAKKDLPESNSISVRTAPHSAKIFRMK